MTLGFGFLITKFGALILFSTDNLIITKIYGPAEVVPYQIAYKFFSIVMIGYSIIVTPYWSSITKAFAQNDLHWIKSSISSIQKIWLIIPLLLIIMVLFSNDFYSFWVGEKIIIPESLSLSMAFFVLIYTYNQIFNMFINGTGTIRIHIYVSIFIAIINIPLSIFLSRNLNFGPSGVILSTSICLLLKTCFLPLQYSKIIKKCLVGFG